MTNRRSGEPKQAACGLCEGGPDRSVQVSSPYHKGNPAASSHYIAERQREPSSSLRAKATHSDRQKSRRLRRWVSPGYGERNVHKARCGTGEILLDRGESREKVLSINLRMKGWEVERKSEQAIVPEDEDNITSSSPKLRQGKGL